jgi:hypothetical protein
MGIQGFTASASGVPGKQYIAQTYLSTQYRQWSQGSGPGYYTVISSGGNAGYAYFNSSGATVGAPINGVADVTGGSGFTSITIVGQVGDVVSLYKVSGLKSTSSLSSTMNTTTYSSTQTGVTLSTNKTGFVDAFLIGGGGGGSHGHYGSGGGGGGVVLLQSWPLDPVRTFNVTVGAPGATRGNFNGGNTVFAGARALGGGYGAQNHSQPGGNGGCGGGGGHHNGSSAGAGKAIQGTGTQGLDIPVVFPSGYGNTAALVGFGNDGGQFTGSNTHAGSGGGGAGGAASGMDGGPGYTLSWNGTQYGAGGSGVRHSNEGHGSNGAGWGNAGSGAHSQTPNTNNAQTQGTAGVVIVRSYSLS